LLIAPQNRWDGVDTGHALGSSCLLHIEASQVRVSQSGLKTGGGAMVRGACDIITEVVLESR
jgi:hypothetical protein